MQTDDFDPEVYWYIESGSVLNPIYFCLGMKNGKPVWSINIYEAKPFKTKEIAEIICQEWNLKNVRICQHSFI